MKANTEKKRKENIFKKIDRVVSETPLLEFLTGGLIGIIFTTFFYLTI